MLMYSASCWWCSVHVCAFHRKRCRGVGKCTPCVVFPRRLCTAIGMLNTSLHRVSDVDVSCYTFVKTWGIITLLLH